MKQYCIDMNYLEELETDLLSEGWEARYWNEGCLLNGDHVLQAPDDKHYSFVIRENYANEWSSYYTIMRCRTIPQKYITWCDDFDTENYYREKLVDAGKVGLRCTEILACDVPLVKKRFTKEHGYYITKSEEGWFLNWE